MEPMTNVFELHITNEAVLSACLQAIYTLHTGCLVPSYVNQILDALNETSRDKFPEKIIIDNYSYGITIPAKKYFIDWMRCFLRDNRNIYNILVDRNIDLNRFIERMAHYIICFSMGGE